MLLFNLIDFLHVIHQVSSMKEHDRPIRISMLPLQGMLVVNRLKKCKEIKHDALWGRILTDVRVYSTKTG